MQRVLPILALILSLAALATSIYVAVRDGRRRETTSPTSTNSLAPGEIVVTTAGLFPPDQDDIAHHLGVNGRRFTLNTGDRGFRAEITYEVWRKGKVVQTNRLGATETVEGQIKGSLSLPRDMDAAGRKAITATFAWSNERGSTTGTVSFPIEDLGVQQGGASAWIPGVARSRPAPGEEVVICGIVVSDVPLTETDYRKGALAFILKAKFDKNEMLK